MQNMIEWPMAMVRSWLDAAKTTSGIDRAAPAVRTAPTPRSVVREEGTSRLYRFHRTDGAAVAGPPILLVPSMINRWYILDLRPGASVVEALVGAGFDTWLLDWGIPEDEDRYLSWEMILDRLRRHARAVRRATNSASIPMLGYCMGGTLTAIHAALHPHAVSALINLAGPIDFSRGGMLSEMVDARWFDGDAIADAGNVSPMQMQSGFTALRPTLDLVKWVGQPDLIGRPDRQIAFRALETWAADNIPFPGEAYRTYIRELYQDNALARGTHRVRGRRVDLKAIACPTLAIVASRDSICPRDAACALLDLVSSRDTGVLQVPGGHVGAVVGGKAGKEMYPALIEWLKARPQPPVGT